MQVFTAAFDDPHDMGAALRTGAEVEYLSHAARGYRARLTVAHLGAVSVGEVEDGAHSARVRLDAGRIVLIFGHATVSPDIRVNGHALGNDDAMLTLPGGELRSMVPDSPHWLMLNLMAEAFAEQLDAVPAETRAGGFAALPGFIGATPGLRRIARETGMLARRHPARLLNPAVAAALQEAIAAQLGAGLLGLRGRTDVLRAERFRMRLVSRAEAFLDSVISRPVYTDEVCQALGVSDRALNDAFNAVYGMSLHRALRIRRLNLARQRLRAADARADLVKIVALDLGFWHFGRFAIAYRELFGESPSETLARRR